MAGQIVGRLKKGRHIIAVRAKKGESPGQAMKRVKARHPGSVKLDSDAIVNELTADKPTGFFTEGA